MRQLSVGAALMFLAVALGAIGAHAFGARLESTGHQDTWQTAVLYHLVHGLALVAVGIWQAADRPRAHAAWSRASGWLWASGILLFSGSLYVWSLGGPKWLVHVTPLGGLCFLAGWALLAIGLGRRTRAEGATE